MTPFSMPPLDSPPTLSNLPPNIINIIVRMAEESLEHMRLIAPSWNTAVLAHLSDPLHKPVLERVLLSLACDADFIDDDEGEADSDVCVRLWAMVPEHCAPARIGLGKWLHVHERFEGAIEVTCAPQKLRWDEASDEECEDERNLTRRRQIRTNLMTLALGASLIVGSALLARRCYKASFGTALFGAPAALYLYRTATILEETSSKFKRLERFFAAFSHIGTLAIDEYPDDRDLEYALKTLGGIQAEKLDVRCRKVFPGTREIIVKLVRRHGIRHVSLHCYDMRKDCFVDFAMQILQCNATLDIFESGMSTEQPKHFHRTRSYWAKKAHELDKLGFSMTISCVHDTDFDARFTDTDMFARMHISIVTKEQRERGVNNTIYESRGFQPE